ncbi:MAG: hypothetical protein WCQ41_09380 [Bacillota bacterium]
MEIKKKEKVEKNIELWKYLDSKINEKESQYVNIYGFFFTVISASTVFAIINNVLLLIYAIPVGVIFLMNYLSAQHREVALLRGYLQYLEDEINSCFDNKMYIWNTGYIMKYVKNNLPNWYIFIFNGVLFAGYMLYLFSLTISNFDYYIIFKIVYLIAVSLAFILTGVEFAKNDDKIDMSRKYIVNENN